MARYILDHHGVGERARLALMSRLLDPLHRRYIDALGIGTGDAAARWWTQTIAFTAAQGRVPT